MIRGKSRVIQLTENLRILIQSNFGNHIECETIYEQLFAFKFIHSARLNAIALIAFNVLLDAF